MDKLSFDTLARQYCDKQALTPAELLQTLRQQKEKFSPTGWMLAECQMLDSSYMGSLTVMPYGPNNTFKEVLTCPFSPRGLASDQSCVVGYLPVEDLPSELPASLNDWVEPPPPKKRRRR